MLCKLFVFLERERERDLDSYENWISIFHLQSSRALKNVHASSSLFCSSVFPFIAGYVIDINEYHVGSF